MPKLEYYVPQRLQPVLSTSGHALGAWVRQVGLSQLSCVHWVRSGGDRGSGSHWVYDGGPLVRKSIQLRQPVMVVTFKYAFPHTNTVQG